MPPRTVDVAAQHVDAELHDVLLVADPGGHGERLGEQIGRALRVVALERAGLAKQDLDPPPVELGRCHPGECLGMYALHVIEVAA